MKSSYLWGNFNGTETIAFGRAVHYFEAVYTNSIESTYWFNRWCFLATKKIINTEKNKCFFLYKPPINSFFFVFSRNNVSHKQTVIIGSLY